MRDRVLEWMLRPPGSEDLPKTRLNLLVSLLPEQGIAKKAVVQQVVAKQRETEMRRDPHRQNRRMAEGPMVQRKPRRLPRLGSRNLSRLQIFCLPLKELSKVHQKLPLTGAVVTRF